MNEVWRARCGIVARWCARGRVRPWRRGSGCGDVAAAGSAAGPALAAGADYPLACLIAIAVWAFTAAGNDRLTAVGQRTRRASQADLARLRAPWDPVTSRYRTPDEKTIRRSRWSSIRTWIWTEPTSGSPNMPAPAHTSRQLAAGRRPR